MSIFIVDDSHELNSIEVRNWLIDLIESKVIMAECVNGAKRILTKYSRALEDGTTLDLLYVDNERDPLVISRKDEEIYCGYLLFGYDSSFGNPLPYLDRMVFDLDSSQKKICLRTKYLEVEERVAAIKAEALLDVPKKVVAASASKPKKPKGSTEKVREKKGLPAKAETKPPTLSSQAKRAAKQKAVAPHPIQQSLF